MLNIIKTSLDEKQFFAQNFSLSLKFGENGILSGKITHFAAALKLTRCFEGFYCPKKKDINAVFFIDWSDVDLDWDVLTAFSGRIFSYKQDHICLVLKWLRISESRALPKPFCSNDFEILLDSPSIDLGKEQEKIRSRISFDVF